MPTLFSSISSPSLVLFLRFSLRLLRLTPCHAPPSPPLFRASRSRPRQLARRRPFHRVVLVLWAVTLLLVSAGVVGDLGTRIYIFSMYILAV